LIFNDARIRPAEVSYPMIWIWEGAREIAEFGASIDYLASAQATGMEYLSTSPVDIDLKAIYRTRNALSRFKKLHSPPIGSIPAVDQLWIGIILKFVPRDRVQFLPTRLIGRGEICDDYFTLVTFDRVRAVDLEKSEVTRKIKKPDITYVFGIKEIVFKEGGLNGLHLARDEQTDHLLVSNQLKEALSATGQDSVFYTAEEISSSLFNF
jgi:hypothetical protein